MRPAQVSSTSTAPRSATPSSPPATRWRSTRSPSRSWPACRPRGWPSCTARSRTRWCWCSPRWSTSASASTSTSCGRSASGSPTRCRRSRRQLREVAGRDDLNLNSPEQLREILYDERGLTPGKKTKTGYSTDAATLEKIKRPVARVHRTAAALPRGREAAFDLRRGAAGRGRPPTAGSTPRSTRPWRAPGGCRPTSRTSTTSRCAPTRVAQFRKAFVPAPGTTLLVADYNQIELRCIAHLAEDPGLIDAFTQWSGHPQRHGVAGVRRRAGRGHGRAAIEGEDGVVRPRLRHGGLRARSAPEHRHRGGRRDPRRVLRGVPEREGLHGPHGRSRRASVATPRRCSVVAARSPS